MPFQPTDELPIRLSVTEWNQIIAALHEEKYRISNPLINKINTQAAQHEQNQLLAQQQATPPQPPGGQPAPQEPQPSAYANGELRGDIGPMPDAPRPPGWTDTN